MYSGTIASQAYMLQKRITVDQLNQVEVYAHGLQSAKYVALAAFTMIFWHWCTHLDEEARHFWHGPWTLTRCLFLANRYLCPMFFICSLIVNFYPAPSATLYVRFHLATAGLLFLICSKISCASWSHWYPWWLYLQLIFGEFVLLLRVMALYPRNIFIRVFVGLAYLSSIGISIALISTILNLKIYTNPLPSILTGCLAGNPPDHFWALYIPSLIFETLLFILTVCKIRNTHSNEQSAPILNVLLRDGTFVFLASAAALLFSSVGSLFTTTVIPASKSSFLIAVSSVGCSHLLLNIKQLQLSQSEALPAALRLTNFYQANKVVEGNTTFVNLEVHDEVNTSGRGFELSHVGRWDKAASEIFPSGDEERWETGEVGKDSHAVPSESER